MREIIFVLLAATLSSTVFASEDYNILVGVVHSKSEGGDGFTGNADLIGGTYYFESVKTNLSQPYAEAPFLQRASSISGFVGNTQYESTTEQSDRYTPLGASATLYKGDFIFGISVQDWANSSRKISNLSRGYDMKNSVCGFMLGYFVGEDTSINYEHSKTTIGYSPVGGEPVRVDLVDSSKRISVHTVIDAGDGRFISAGLSYGSIDRAYTSNTENHEYSGIFRYYPSQKSYLEYVSRMRQGDRNGTNGRTNAMALGFELSNQLDVRLSNSRFSPSDLSSNYDTNNWQVGLNFKF
jgi:hypothetical protein